MAVALPAPAETIEKGYFTGINLTPLSGATMTMAAADPAAVIVFSTDASSIEATKQFSAWQQQPHSYEYAIFGVVQVREDQPREMAEEVLNQRGIGFPVFSTRADLLQGQSSRVLLISRGEADRLASVDPAAIEARMNEYAAKAGAKPAAGSQPGAAASPPPSPASGESVSRDPVYANTRFDYSVQFPRGWEYRIADNKDGAVAKPPPGVNLDFRVWAAPNQEIAQGDPGKMTVVEYVNRHIAFISEDIKGRVDIDRKFIVRDDNTEGRDYSYSYTRTAAEPGKPAGRIRGRIQVFDSGGVFKVAGAEGPAAEFERSQEMIEDFIVSFKPALQE